MCFSAATIAAIAGATAATAGAVQSYETGRRARNQARDAERAAALADTRATQDANARIAMRRRALSQNSLVTGGGGESMGMTGGKSTLGG